MQVTVVDPSTTRELRRRMLRPHLAPGDPLLWCRARESAVGFYARYGFERHGPVFTDDLHPIPHQNMWRELSGDGTSS